MSNVKVIPCSGMGKVYGLIARESAIRAVELCPGKAELVCLAHIVTGDPDAEAKIKGQDCITLDGCPARCAAKNAELAGGNVKAKIRVVDAFRKHKGAKPGTATALSSEGWQIADEIAEELAKKIRTEEEG